MKLKDFLNNCHDDTYLCINIEDTDEAGRHEAEMVSLRDKFAIAVLQGIFANPSGPIQSNTMSGWGWCNCEPNDVTSLVYLIADEMLKERNK